MCAIDALGIAAMLAKTGCIARILGSGAELQVQVGVSLGTS
jgi:hypothetical protein